MRKIKKEVKKVEVEKEVVVSNTLHCNVCDKEIKSGHHYWVVHTSIKDDPYIGKDVCSEKCLTNMLNEYMKVKDSGASFEVLCLKEM